MTNAHYAEKDTETSLRRAADIIDGSKRLFAFTGAGISKESGLPVFRGEGGIWERMDPGILEISRFARDPEGSWRGIRDLFYDVSSLPAPNAAHRVLAKWEAEGRLASLVTQNIDGLHRAAGSRRVIEFHGTLGGLLCLRCGRRISATPAAIAAGVTGRLPPRCKDWPGDGAALSRNKGCDGILKPDFVFFGEGIPPEAYTAALAAAEAADVCLIVGSAGVVHPAAQLPGIVQRNGGTIIEIDPSVTEFTKSLTDIHIRLGAVEGLTSLDALLPARA
ncbi:MAG: SIR2 family NAD-dependent protein deacylase [Rectinemataceae bacterium]